MVAVAVQLSLDRDLQVKRHYSGTVDWDANRTLIGHLYGTAMEREGLFY